jgi:hypothetical protein
MNGSPMMKHGPMSPSMMKGKAMRGALEELLGALASANVDRARKRKKKKPVPEMHEHEDMMDEEE